LLQGAAQLFPPALTTVTKLDSYFFLSAISTESHRVPPPHRRTMNHELAARTFARGVCKKVEYFQIFSNVSHLFSNVLHSFSSIFERSCLFLSKTCAFGRHLRCCFRTSGARGLLGEFQRFCIRETYGSNIKQVG
jgi:hypothetical protein